MASRRLLSNSAAPFWTALIALIRNVLSQAAATAHGSLVLTSHNHSDHLKAGQRMPAVVSQTAATHV
jgi:L-ascorbate metabolism protein UlaG (beta-lactamase superfamily)